MENIWQEDDTYYKLKSLSDKEVVKAEEKLKVKLPESFINLLKKQNGGYINYNSFPSTIPNSWAEDHINIDHIWGIAEEEGILNSEYLIAEWELPQNIVLFSGDGHSWVAFDYRNTKVEPPVIYIDTDSEQIIELAPNFDAFLNGLYIEETEFEEIFFEEDKNQWTLDEVARALSTDNEQQIIHAFDYLFENTKGNEQFIEQKLIVLLQSPILEIKELAVTVANHFYKTGVLSTNGINEIISIIQMDKEIEYYVKMYFNGK